MKNNGKILYIDDSRENLEGFYYTFFKTFKVFIAQNKSEALNIIDNENPQVVISDQRMPDITGIDLIEEIKKTHPNIIFILITAYTDIDILVNAINRAGVFRFMSKPWDKTDMNLTITSALETFSLKEINKDLIFDLKTTNKTLESTNLTLHAEIEERKSIEKQLRDYQINLKQIINERTQELDKANNVLTKLNKQLTSANKKLKDEVLERENAQQQLENYRNHLEQLVIEKTAQILESEEKYRTIFESSIEPILIINYQLEIIKANTAFYNLIENQLEEQQTLIKITDFIQSKHHSKIYHIIDHVIIYGYFHNLEVELIDSYNKKHELNINVRSINYDNKQSFLIVGQDITDKKNIQKKIYHAMLKAEETERQKLSNDLHDDVGPLLSSLKLYIDALKNIQLDDNTRNTFLENSIELVSNTINSIREISNSLSPSVLNKFGLIASLYNLIEKTKPLIPVKFYESLNETRFDPNIEIVVYRIIKELINNTIKHANASLIEIDLDIKAEYLLLSYTDNGKGFNLEAIDNENPKGLGINSILNRVKSIDASAEFITSPDNGLKFYLEIPLNVDENGKNSNY